MINVVVAGQVIRMILRVSQKDIQVTAVGPPHNTVQTQVGIGIGVMVVVTHSLQSLEVTAKGCRLCVMWQKVVAR